MSIIIIKLILKKNPEHLNITQSDKKNDLQGEKLPIIKSEKSFQGPLSVFNLAQAPFFGGGGGFSFTAAWWVKCLRLFQPCLAVLMGYRAAQKAERATAKLPLHRG